MAEHPAVVFLRQALDRAEELARAAGGGECEAVEYLWESKYVNVYQPDGTVRHTTEFSAELADHFAMQSPAAVLRRVAADRQILAEHGSIPGSADDLYCTVCSQEEVQPQPVGWWVPWPCRTVRLLAEAWGWTEDAR